MPTFTFTSPDGKNYTINGPDGATQEQAFQILQQQIGGGQQQQKADVNPAVDFGRSIPRGAVSGFTGALANIGQSAALDAQYSGVPTADPASMPTGQQGMDEIEKATGPMYKPQGRAGRVGEAIGEGLGNPTSYIGPGGLPLKIAGSVLSSAGGELGGQAAEGTGYEGAARLAGALVGGAGAVKTMGARVPEAATPSPKELMAAGGADINAARQLGVDIKPQAFAQKAADIKSGLENDGVTSILAEKTHKTLDALASPPEGAAAVTVDNYRAAQKTLGSIANEARAKMLRTGEGGEEWLAAVRAKDQLASYLKNIPSDSVLAGDAEQASNLLQRGNANYAAGKRAEGVAGKLDAAEVQTQTAGAGSNLDNKIRQKIAPIAINKAAQYGFNPEEIAQARSVAVGTPGANFARKLGKLGFNDGLTMLYHLAAAPLTLGASVPVGIAGTLSRKLAERMTVNRANKLADLLAQRSPLYQDRVNALPPADTITNKSALARALMNGLQQ